MPQDYVLAHKWLNLAAVEGDKESEKARNLVEKLMTSAEIAEAQRLAREWKPKNDARLDGRAMKKKGHPVPQVASP